MGLVERCVSLIYSEVHALFALNEAEWVAGPELAYDTELRVPVEHANIRRSCRYLTLPGGMFAVAMELSRTYGGLPAKDGLLVAQRRMAEHLKLDDGHAMEALRVWGAREGKDRVIYELAVMKALYPLRVGGLKEVFRVV